VWKEVTIASIETSAGMVGVEKEKLGGSLTIVVPSLPKVLQ